MHDKSMTNRGRKAPRRGPFSQVRHGSAVVPIYCGKIKDQTRYTVAFYLNRQRVRRTFGTIEAAKAEARKAAQKIQDGLSWTNDLGPQDRDAFLAAQRILKEFDVPLVAAVDEYARCRRRLTEVPLLCAVDEFLRRTRDVKIGAKVPAIMEEFLKSKKQDKISACYLLQLSQRLGRFAKAFPGEIMHIKSAEIDRWLRGQAVVPTTRNSTLRCVKVFFAWAKTHSYLPRSEASAAELLSMVKTGDTAAEVFTPDQMQKLLLAAPKHLVAMLAIGGFAGLRAAEIARLDWSAVNLERRIITLRADQAKTASRRIIPISDNLAAWLSLVPGKGKVLRNSKSFVEAFALARKAGLEWPRNVLRHSFISYRIAQVQDAGKVALEAGNSPAIIFKHYRELVTQEDAAKWFGILPPEGWQPVDREQEPNLMCQARIMGAALNQSATALPAP